MFCLNLAFFWSTIFAQGCVPKAETSKYSLDSNFRNLGRGHGRGGHFKSCWFGCVQNFTGGKHLPPACWILSFDDFPKGSPQCKKVTKLRTLSVPPLALSKFLLCANFINQNSFYDIRENTPKSYVTFFALMASLRVTGQVEPRKS